MGRFVLHHHTGHGAPHYDLMLQQPGEGLATWSLPDDPGLLKVGESLPCRRLDDHRQAYLDYEGPVSRGRGQVRRVDTGSVEILHVQGDRWTVRLAGEHLHGLYDLQARAGAWQIQCIE